MSIPSLANAMGITKKGYSYAAGEASVGACLFKNPDGIRGAKWFKMPDVKPLTAKAIFEWVEKIRTLQWSGFEVVKGVVQKGKDEL